MREHNVYNNALGTFFLMAYVDDLLFFGVDTEVTRIFKAIQAQFLLRPTGELVGHTIAFLGRQFTDEDEYMEITLGDKYMNTMLEAQDMHNSRPHPRDGSTQSNKQRSATDTRRTKALQKRSGQVTVDDIH